MHLPIFLIQNHTIGCSILSLCGKSKFMVAFPGPLIQANGDMIVIDGISDRKSRMNDLQNIMDCLIFKCTIEMIIVYLRIFNLNRYSVPPFQFQCKTAESFIPEHQFIVFPG